MKKSDTPHSQVFYRKYRPQTFKEVIGEDHIVRVLENQIKLGTTSHAYLFSGGRGTGKTSVARILAKELGTSQNDLFEMDAATHTSVDDIRELGENVGSMPFESKYKIYIIDEVHMLSKAAFNAFLKTLEEPPAHVVFILATTEIEKVPETIRSRCQTFVFKAPNQSVLKEFALTIAKKEGFTLDTDAAELVALLGDGSFRDSHGILEKVLTSSTDKKISRKDVEAVSGAPKAELVRKILESIVHKDLSLGLEAIQSAASANADMKLFSKLILERLRFLFLLRLKAGMDEYVATQVSEDDLSFLKELALKAGPNLTSETLVRFIEAYESAGRTSIPELALELALADVLK
ncbi:MAG: polymerase subunit gamma and tau, polymerase subunit gamma/tau protein [Parcubacteria group bacterium]|nr:polymerase subunit gamma and tau, polymerase subunit gamma/tau protein [Parcubacteria group bacterium]